jgi:hypothetical protein
MGLGPATGRTAVKFVAIRWSDACARAAHGLRGCNARDARSPPAQRTSCTTACRARRSPIVHHAPWAAARIDAAQAPERAARQGPRPSTIYQPLRDRGVRSISTPQRTRIHQGLTRAPAPRRPAGSCIGTQPSARPTASWSRHAPVVGASTIGHRPSINLSGTAVCDHESRMRPAAAERRERAPCAPRGRLIDKGSVDGRGSSGRATIP